MPFHIRDKVNAVWVGDLWVGTQISNFGGQMLSTLGTKMTLDQKGKCAGKDHVIRPKE